MTPDPAGFFPSDARDPDDRFLSIREAEGGGIRDKGKGPQSHLTTPDAPGGGLSEKK